MTDNMIKAFGASRMAVGAISWLAPRASARIFGLNPDSQNHIVTQLFGVRDFTIGYLTATTSGERRRDVLRMGAMIDATDTVASLRQMRAGRLGPQAMLLVAAGAASFTALGAWALSAEGATAPPPAA